MLSYNCYTNFLYIRGARSVVALAIVSVVTCCDQDTMDSDSTNASSGQGISAATEQVRVTWEPEAAAAITAQLESRASSPHDTSTPRPLMVALVGIPGAGKTTSSQILQRLLPDALIVPVDGFHHYRSQLRSRDDADEAVYRRGTSMVDACV